MKDDKATTNPEYTNISKHDDPDVPKLGDDDLKAWLDDPWGKTIENLLERCRRLEVVHQQVEDGRWTSFCEQKLRISVASAQAHGRVYLFYGKLEAAYMQRLPAKRAMLDELRKALQHQHGGEEGMRKALRQLIDDGWIWPDMQTADMTKLMQAKLGKSKPVPQLSLGLRCPDETRKAALERLLDDIKQDRHLHDRFAVVEWLAQQHAPKQKKAA